MTRPQSGASTCTGAGPSGGSGGVNNEAVMLSLAGATMRESACDFSLTQSAGEEHDDVVALKQKLMHAFDALARKQPVPSVGALIKALRKPMGGSRRERR